MKPKKPRRRLPLRAATASPEPPPEGATNPPKRVGYVRVSTHEQNTDLQYDALIKAGCDPIFEDRITGVSLVRDGLDQALDMIGRGDKLVVWRLDRLGRSTHMS